MSSNKTRPHPTGSPLPELAWAITAGAVRLAAATAAWLRLVAEFDERGGWHGVGINSCAHWLSWQCGIVPVTAREHVRVARVLGGLPQIAAAFDAGRLSYAKVRALTRVAAPDCEATLLEFASTATASQTERFCRAWRRADDEAAGPERSPEDGHSFRSWNDDDGFTTIKIRMRTEAAAPLLSRIDSLAEREARRERAQNEKARARHERIRAAGGQVDDALTRRCAEDVATGLVRERTAARRISALASLAEARVHTDRRPGDPPRREVVVHVDADVLADDAAAGRAHFEGGPAITAAQARRMLCEATAVVMLEKGREPLAVGRSKRRATRAQRRALLHRDGGCARAGCPETRIERLHAHHMRHWLHGGRTELANLVLLCDADHGLVHDHELILFRRDGRLVVLTPDGRHIWGTADAAFTNGVAGAERAPDRTEDFVGVHPIDDIAGRRPAGTEPTRDGDRLPALPRKRRPSRPALRRPTPAGRPPNRPHRRTHTVEPQRLARRIRRTLFPDGEPPLADTFRDRYDRMDLHYAVGVLMTNRDIARRLATAAGVPLTG